MPLRLLVVALALLMPAGVAAAQGAAQLRQDLAGRPAPRPFPVITVGGEASVSLRPDLAEATGGVTTEAKTVREASDANTQLMGAVIAALKDSGLPERDIQTSQFTISPVYAQAQNRQNRPDEPRIVGYRVSNQVQFKIRDIAKVSDVLDHAIAAGATDLRGISFTVSDMSKAKDAARAEAVSDARRRAETYAKAAGAQIGQVIAITESGQSPPRPMAFAASERMAAAAPPIAVGETTLRVGVSVSFELVP